MFIDDDTKRTLSELEAKRILDELAKKANVDLTILSRLAEEIYIFWKFAEELGLIDIPRVCVFSKGENGVQFIGISNLDNVYSDSSSSSFQDELYTMPINIYKNEQDREQAIDSLIPYAKQNDKDEEYVSEKWKNAELNYCLEKKVDRVQ